MLKGKKGPLTLWESWIVNRESFFFILTKCEKVQWKKFLSQRYNFFNFTLKTWSGFLESFLSDFSRAILRILTLKQSNVKVPLLKLQTSLQRDPPRCAGGPAPAPAQGRWQEEMCLFSSVGGARRKTRERRGGAGLLHVNLGGDGGRRCWVKFGGWEGARGQRRQRRETASEEEEEEEEDRGRVGSWELRQTRTCV